MIPDIQYGSSFNQMTQQQEDLMLDAYLPPDSDTREKRPAVVYMHGGAFVGGDKQMAGATDFVKMLTQLGYVVFSINYRLTGDHWR